MSPVSSSNRRIRVPSPAARRKSEPVRGTLVYGALAARLVVAFLLLIVAQGAAAAASIPGEGSARPVRADQGVTWSNFAPASWVTQVAFSSSVTASSSAGLDASSDAYSVSTDGGANWSAWSTTGLSTAIPISTRHDITVTNLTLPDSASLDLIRFRVTETGGAENISQPYLLRVDATPPASPQNLAANPPAWTNAGSFTVSWTNPSDAAGIAGAWYKLNSPPTSPSDGTFVITSNSIDGITPGTPGVNDGAHHVYVWLQDIFDRADPKTASTTTLYWDTTAPDPPTFFSPSPARQWVNTNKFTESWRNPSDLSGIAGAYYKLNGLPTSPTDGIFVKTVNTISDIQVPHDGRHDIYVWLVDTAGNVDHDARSGDPDAFWYDATLPVSASIVTPTLPATGWYTGSVSMSFSASDLPVEPLSPPVVEYELDSAPGAVTPPVLTVSSEGLHRLKYHARDKANNLEATKEFDFGIDKTPPIVMLQADRLPNSTGWYTAAVTYTLSVADLVSGSPQGFYRLNGGPWQEGPVGAPATFALAAEGSYRIEYYGKDAAGNRSKQISLESNIDSIPPVTTLAIDGVKGENGWHLSDVLGHLLAVDNGSGTGSTRYQIGGGAWQTGTEFAIAGDGIYDLSFYSTDAAGNVEPTQAGQVKLDRAAPAAPTDLAAAPAGWSRTNSFNVDWTSPNDLSGVTGVYVKLGDLSGGGAPTGPKDGTAITETQHIDGLALPAEGEYRLYLWLRDAAGNADQKTAPANGPVLRYDATPPTTTAQVQGKAGVDGWWLSPITATLTAADSASGVAGLHYRLDGGCVAVDEQEHRRAASQPARQACDRVLRGRRGRERGGDEAIHGPAGPHAPAGAACDPRAAPRLDPLQQLPSRVAHGDRPLGDRRRVRQV